MRTTSTSHTTATPTATCVRKSKGKKKHDGYKDCCCFSSDDCKEICTKGGCNGPGLKTSIKTSIILNSCVAGAKGEKKGDDKKGYCCSLNDDYRKKLYQRKI